MKTYKLIKTYPGSPPINSIFKESDKYPSLLVSEDGMSYLVKYYITDHPEYWEQINVLEEWLKNTKAKNLSIAELSKYINNLTTCNHEKVYKKLEGFRSNGKAQILWDKWNSKPEIEHVVKTKKPVSTYIYNKIISFRNNTGTGANYTYNKNTDKYHSNKSSAQVPFDECMKRYPIHSVINTERNILVVGDMVCRTDVNSETEYEILEFGKKRKNLFAKLRSYNQAIRYVDIDNLEHYV